MQPQLKSPAIAASPHASSRLRGETIGATLVLAILLMGAPLPAQADPSGPPASASPAGSFAVLPPEPSCDNQTLTAYGGLLVLAPHPDDETLAFAGLITAYMRQAKLVQIVVV